VRITCRAHRRAGRERLRIARILSTRSRDSSRRASRNSTGNVGKYLTDSTGASVNGFIPKLMDQIPHNDDGVGGAHLYVPWWLDNKKLDFPRGYHIELGGGRSMPQAGFGGGIQRFSGLHEGREIGGYGAQLKNEYRRFYGATINLSGRGEMIPNADTYCEIDPNTSTSSAFRSCAFTSSGPTPKSTGRSTCRRRSAPIITEMGARRWGTCPARISSTDLANGGRIITNRHDAHGQQPATSVLNKNGQAHDAGTCS
jgi:hypothetical protein